MQFSFDTNLNRIAEKVEANEHLTFAEWNLTFAADLVRGLIYFSAVRLLLELHSLERVFREISFSHAIFPKIYQFSQSAFYFCLVVLLSYYFVLRFAKNAS
jgi:hypothetical protein